MEICIGNIFVERKEFSHLFDELLFGRYHIQDLNNIAFEKKVKNCVRNFFCKK